MALRLLLPESLPSLFLLLLLLPPRSLLLLPPPPRRLEEEEGRDHLPLLQKMSSLNIKHFFWANPLPADDAPLSDHVGGGGEEDGGEEGQQQELIRKQIRLSSYFLC